MMNKPEATVSGNKSCEVGKSKVRDRIFDTACELFYEHGIRCVGVDAIANAAGTNKMSFYRSFPSKDDLVLEYLREHERAHWEWWDATIAPHHGAPEKQIMALFEGQLAKSRKKDKHGCAFLNAMVEIRETEHPAREVVYAYKAETRRRFRKLAKEAGAQTPDVLGDALTLIASGNAMSSISFSCQDGPVVNSPKIVKKLLEAYLQ
ncbi:MAG: Transcriptional regulator, TetR family [Verrucomicrobiaceae bacterium]|nr:Transcriptional regulator, TetR family [Verrucomicrobiaceae bacterium]